MNGDRLERVVLLLILLAYGLLAVLYATQTPPWQIPDEPAHYNYVRQVAESGCCPTLTTADWDDAYRQQLVNNGFDPQYLGQLDTVQYEDHQPPLYYLLAAPIFSLSGGSLIALRLFSALLGAGVILGVYGIARAASAGSAPLALGAAAFAAFVPQHVAIMAGAGNDALAELIVAIGTLLALWYLTPEVTRRFRPGPLVLGLVMGLGFLTKVSTFLLGPVIALAILLRWWREADRRWAGLIRALALFLIPALIVGALWWLRNIGLYGWPDFLGLGRHDAVVVGQPRTADWIAREGVGSWLSLGVRTTFDSFWGQFGWMGVPMPDWIYALLLAFSRGQLRRADPAGPARPAGRTVPRPARRGPAAGGPLRAGDRPVPLLQHLLRAVPGALPVPWPGGLRCHDRRGLGRLERAGGGPAARGLAALAPGAGPVVAGGPERLRPLAGGDPEFEGVVGGKQC